MERDTRPAIRCAFEGCRAITEQPYTDGWANLWNWGCGLKDGFYWRAHANALEQVLEKGGFDDPENDLGDEQP
jgi:hypothetical protein